MSDDQRENGGGAATDAEFVYFGSPEVDRLVSLVWQLAQELYVTRSRLIALEGALTAHGALPADALEPPALSEATRQAVAEDNRATMERLIRVLTETDDHRVPMREQFLAALQRIPRDSANG
jgi:hypothetical protein